MTDSTHPSIDELADLHAGILDRSDVASHVVGCTQCARDLTAFESVTAMLAAEGAAPVPIPAAVAASIDDTIRRAALERESGVPSLAEHRAKTSTTRRSRWTLVAGAAATVLIGAAGFNALNGTSNSESNTPSAASDAVQEGTDAATGGTPRNLDEPEVDSHKQSLQSVNKTNLRAFANSLATDGVVTGGIQAPRCPALPAGPADFSSAVRWRGSAAYVVVDPKAREATVYQCGEPLLRLYSTPY